VGAHITCWKGLGAAGVADLGHGGGGSCPPPLASPMINNSTTEDCPNLSVRFSQRWRTAAMNTLSYIVIQWCMLQIVHVGPIFWGVSN